ncbi:MULTISPECIES: ProQ/FinO family protein [Pseudomonas]|uniref:ProQ/FinO family protein n=1 Tax=Pseudomonas TaxID=286 RepID=UPI0023629370|nr:MULTISPECIES: ProQ/FinO family protein [Pseudomonas]WJV25538.1 ProQ/FinO family protein [Pseudomonas chlororaphis]
MGFEQLAELRDRLREQAENSKPAEQRPVRRSKPKAAESKAKKRAPADPAMEAIWRLQKSFPLAFPRSPAPKVPLKVGIYQDAVQHLERLGITSEQLKRAIATWCRGARYWSSLVENAARVNLNGEPVGTVTPEQAQRANTRPTRRTQERHQAKRPRPGSNDAESSVVKSSTSAESPEELS